MPGILCKTYVEGYGWMYNHDLYGKPPKTADERYNAIVDRLSRKNRCTGVLEAKNDMSRKWETPTRDQKYIRDLELNNKYRNF